jgi:hypothetical protein
MLIRYPGQTEGLKVGCGGMGVWVGCEVWVDRRAEGWIKTKYKEVFKGVWV